MDEGMDAEDAFLMSVSRPILSTDVKLKKFQTLIEEITGKANVPFGISEYTCWNADLCDEQLASAFLNAELLNIFMKPENNVLMANHWHMSNGSNGMIKAKHYVNHDYRKPIYCMKRPQYYVFEMYNRIISGIVF